MLSFRLNNLPNNRIIIPQHDMNGLLNKMLLIRRYHSHKSLIGSNALPCFDIFDPYLCDAVVFRDGDLEFGGCFFEAGGGVPL
jgi:hypothetical protein